MKTEIENCEMTVAALVAGEDLARGDFVAALNEVTEMIPCSWCCDPTLARLEPIRVVTRAGEAGAPMKIKAVCLPFVFVRTPAGEVKTIDTRQTQLVRLDKRYGRIAWRALKPKAAQEKDEGGRMKDE